MKVIVASGLAGGGSCAACLRRPEERAEILVVERSPYASHEDCGLPHHVGDVIEKRASLLAADGGMAFPWVL